MSLSGFFTEGNCNIIKWREQVNVIFFQPQKRSKALDLSEPVQQGKTKQQMAYFLT